MRGNGTIHGDLSLVGTGSDLFVGGSALIAGGNSSLTIADIGVDFEVSGDSSFMGFPITLSGVSNQGFVNPFTAENLGLPARFSDLIIAGGPLGYYHQSFTSDDTDPFLWEGYIGSTTPTDSVFAFLGHKWNGTTGKANLASSEKLMTIDNGSTRVTVFGDSTINLDHGKMSFIGAGTYPTDNDSWIGTTNSQHNLTLNQEVSFTMVFQIAGTQAASMDSNGVFTFAPPAKATGAPKTFIVTGAAHTGLTAGSNITDLYLDFSATMQHATNSVSLQETIKVLARTYSFVGASTVSTVGTMSLGAPNAGTNATFTDTWALQVGAAASIGPSAASQTYEALNLANHQITITGTTQNTLTTAAFALIRTGLLTITDASSVTIDNAAAVYIAGAPLAQGSVTITKSYSLWVDSGVSLFRGGILLENSGQSTLSNYTEGTFTPTVTLVGGAGNTVPVYSTNTGRYTRIGNRVFVDVYLTGDGGAEGAGTGVFSVALPVVASASNPTSYFPAGFFANGTAEDPLWGQIVGSGSVIDFAYEDVLNNFTVMTGAEQNNATRTVRLKFFYEV